MAAKLGPPSLSSEESRWLMEAPLPGEIKIRLAAGEGAVLTPEFAEALERLADAMAQAEVLAYAGRLGQGSGADERLPFHIHNERSTRTGELLIDFHVRPRGRSV